MYTLPLHAATSVVANNKLPDFNSVLAGQLQGGKPDTNGLVMDVTQTTQNAVIKWNSFDIGGSATVNFDYTGKENFNTLNYVNSGSASQIYGTINAQHEGYAGNIFVVNTAGVQIGPSAQINVGSLHVSNKNLDKANFSAITDDTNLNDFLHEYDTYTNAALMSLGNINANKVTFEGDGRIVIDSERIKNAAGDEVNNSFEVHTNDAGNVIIGYDAYVATDEDKDGTVDGYKGQDKTFSNNVYVNDVLDNNVKGYMWVEDVEELQAINTNLGGNYALRNSIDATGTEQDKFIAIGSYNNAFKGNFDGIDYNIFGLNIDNNGKDYAGLFGVTDGAVINNVTLVGGSVSGGSDVGAIVGYANNTTISNAGKIESVGETLKDGSTLSNVGGLVGYMSGSNLNGNSYNLGDVSGKGYNVGGLVGHAVNSTIGNEGEDAQLVYNRLDVEGAYNVGGIVGNMEGTTVQNAENSGNVTASGYTKDDYVYHTGENDGIDKYNNYITENVFEKEGNYYIGKVETNVANIGGIAGSSSALADGTASEIKNVTNTGNVNSSKVQGEKYYAAGNVGGIVGSAVDTNITNATNRENEVRGAHNVGGVAGYFGNSNDAENAVDYTITNGINDGGDIMATGARNENSFVSEVVRPLGDSKELFVVGNIGGVVGYMDGNNVYVTGSANRGTVHTDEPTDPKKVEAWQKAANVGGIVGKIDRSTKNTLDGVKNESEKASVTNSYNTGDVLGYTGVGGIAGMMFNGSVTNSYNLGYLRTTRQSETGGSIDSLNMGGIVGDTTEGTGSVVLYDVYNKGQLGDENFEYYGRHVGGIVGRLSGTVEKAYNTGAIYNGYNVVGGIVGWMPLGSVENAFNTGNITVINRNNATSQVGGIVGAASAQKDITINNVYNLGTIRSFKPYINNMNTGNNSVAGIIGAINGTGGTVSITNAYTTGNIYAGTQNQTNGSYSPDNGNDNNNQHIGSIYSENRDGATIKVENTYYIRPDDGLEFANLTTNNKDNSNKAIDFSVKDKIDQYQYADKDGTNHSLTFTTQSGGDVDGGSDVTASDDNWRIYAGNTPILNAFLPNAEDYFSQSGNMGGIDKIQYGTAYDPLLTIINAESGTTDLSYNWSDLGINNAAGIAVYGAGLTLSGFEATGGTGYFGGTVYADGALTLNGGTNDIGLGSAANIYGSAVNIDTKGKVTIYGNITATGNTDNGATKDNITDTINVENAGDIKITGSDIDVYGKLTSASDTQGATVTIPGIEGNAVAWTPGDVDDPYAAMDDIADRFAHTSGASAVDGNITITAKGTTEGSGNVNLYYGNKQEGLITTGGDLTVTGTGDVYVDSDLAIGGDLTLTGNGTNSEVVLDLTNIGQVQADNGTVTNAVTGLNNFLNHFVNTGKNTISFGYTADAKITVDMWDGNELELNKFGSDFTDKLDKLKVTGVGDKNAQDLTHIWVNNGEQLKNIQTAAKDNANVLGYNFALKGDINASDVENYVAIGTNSQNGFTGTFDGRGNRIIGLKVDGDNAGIFSEIGTSTETINGETVTYTGTVKNVNIYSGNFTGSTNAGAVAGVNNGRIENIVTFGNTVTANGSKNSENIDGNKVGAAGGIAGINKGEIDDVEVTGSVIAGDATDDSKALSTAGGIVGINNAGATVNNSFSDSAVTANADTTYALGGVVGVNEGDVQMVDSLGVTNGGSTGSSNVGGVIGINKGNMYSGYNESIVSGSSNVGGIIGQNTGKYENDKWNGGTVENVVNATSVTSDAADSENVGGLVGTNTGSVTNGRNNGTITGTNYVGGLVGDNADEHSILTNLVNDSSAEILGEEYVGGIAGSNSGTIKADEDNDNLVNRGSITGHKYVGGVAGENKEGATIANTLNSVVLHADKNTSDDPAQYFGGVVGSNSGVIDGATNTSDINITAEGGSYVGGIIGHNTHSGTLKGEILNEGSVSGKSNVGGIIGQNDNDDVLQGTADERLVVKNKGNAVAEDGGAAGIFYKNTGDILYADISNDGVVDGGTGTDGTGGLFGINTGAISNSTLTNSGEVKGAGNVGGLIGVNSGNADNSSLTNTGSVTGINNVGGLIGENTGTITGGRDDNNSYYKDQIYNNGTITGTGNGSNIGGLIGSNKATGSLTAGYNTGAINAGNSTNVGGIAGTNEQGGSIDQVFNTVMVNPADKDQQAAAITGGTNVGGLIGTNSGTLSNAYNTTTVVEGKLTNAIVGNAVGSNTGTITNIYASNTSGNLIGTGYDNGKITNAYSFSNDDDDIENLTVITEDNRQNSDSYDGFDFDGTGITQDNETAVSDGDKDYWKIYSGSGNPLLKVFLTTVTVDTDKLPDIVYNTKDQDLNIGSLTGTGGAFSAADDFKAYQNNNSLIQNTDFEHKNAGTYDNWLYSGQIASGSQEEGTFNPNNLGYDIEFKADIDKAQITVDLNQVDRVYGNTDIINGEYGFSYGFNNVLSDADKTALRDEVNNNNVLNMNAVNADDALVENGTKTNDAGTYRWEGTVNIADGYESNYEFVVKDTGTISNEGATVTTTGDSIVHKRKLSVNDVIANIVYGNQDDKGFIVSGGELIGVNGNVGIVYEDNVTLDTSLKVEDANIVVNSSYANNKGDRVTADVGNYENSLNFSGLGLSGDDAGNYELVNNSVGGTINVTQATINVYLNAVDRTYGNVSFNSNGYSVSNVQNNANDDVYDAGDFVVSVNAGDDGALTGNSSGRVTNDVGNYTYVGIVSSNNDKLNQNYKIVVNNSDNGNNIGSGISTVSKANLSITINDVDTTYGTAFDESKYGYTLDKLVNGDGNSSDIISAIENAINSASGGYNNTGAADGTNGKVTQDAEGDYSLSFKNDITKEEILKNYNITAVTNGDANVFKKQISIGANNEEIHLGELTVY